MATQVRLRVVSIYIQEGIGLEGKFRGLTYVVTTPRPTMALLCPQAFPQLLAVLKAAWLAKAENQMTV